MKSRRKDPSKPRKKRKVPLLRTTKTTLEKRKRFLESYSKAGNITLACEYAGIERSTHYNIWMKDPKYVAKFEDAKQRAGDLIEAEILRRAVQGIDKPVHYKGDRVDTVREYSDLLLIFLAKAVRPEKFRELSQWHGKGQLDLATGSIDVSIIQEAVKDAEE